MTDGAGDDRGLSFQLIPFECLDSTNDEARRRAHGAAALAGTVIWARRQEAGRGRRGRVWVSPEGNLHCSIILRPACEPARAAQLSLVAALAVGDSVAEWLPGRAPPGLKWPNDVLVDGRKIAGILLESDPDPVGRVASVVVGVGINVRHWPEDTEWPATSLVREGAADPEVEAVLNGFLSHFALWYRRWDRSGMAPVRAAWMERASGLGEAVTVRLHDRSFGGRLLGLDEDGQLLLEVDGEGGRRTRRVAAGDVFPA